jgi:hypothetical protein
MLKHPPRISDRLPCFPLPYTVHPRRCRQRSSSTRRTPTSWRTTGTTSGAGKREWPRNDADDDRNYYHVGDPAAGNAAFTGDGAGTCSSAQVVVVQENANYGVDMSGERVINYTESLRLLHREHEQLIQPGRRRRHSNEWRRQPRVQRQ